MNNKTIKGLVEILTGAVAGVVINLVPGLPGWGKWAIIAVGVFAVARGARTLRGGTAD